MLTGRVRNGVPWGVEKIHGENAGETTGKMGKIMENFRKNPEGVR